MKKIKLFLLMLFVMVSSLSFQSCEKKPACEENNTGNVIMHNSFTEPIWVDVTVPGSYMNQEVKLAVGASKTYTMPAGPVVCWYTTQYGYETDQWGADDVYVGQCDEITDNIYKKKSTEFFGNISKSK